MFILLFTVLVIIIFIYMDYNYKYWAKKEVKGPKPRFLIGNLGKSVLWKKPTGEVYTEIYQQYPNESFVGIFRTLTPVLLIRNPEFIKEVLVQSFWSFCDNDVNVNRDHDPLWGRNTFVLKGEEWKAVRAQITPGFTSAKIKNLYPSLEENCENLINHITTKELDKDSDVKDITLCFTLDNIGKVFGIDAKCFEDEFSEFKQIANEIFQPGTWGAFALYIVMTVPILGKIFPIRLLTKKSTAQFIDLVKEALKFREKNYIVQNDFLHAMAQLKNCKEHHFEDIDVAAQAASFFLDGFETSSLTMSFVMYNLSVNIEAQTTLRKEIKEAFAKNSNKLPIEALNNLPYLEAVINESMRLYPIIPFLQKTCTNTHTFKTGLTVKKGTPIVIPVFGLHHDPNYYKNPEKYYPERFLRKENLTNYTFLPFGGGPRGCIGQRIALVQLKLCLAFIVNNFQLSPSPKMTTPIVFDPGYLLTTSLHGFWLRFSKIS